MSDRDTLFFTLVLGIRPPQRWIDCELGHIVWNDEPDVLVFRPNRLRWLRKLGICKCAKCDANEFRHTAWLPIDVRSTANAEVKLDGEAARRSTLEAIGSPALDCDHVSLIEDSDAESAPSSPLASEAVAHRDLSWAADTQQFKISAMTAGCTRFHKFLAWWYAGLTTTP